MNRGQMPDCLLPLKGTVNFRDMGGLKTSDGRTVKRGILFRAAELTRLTEEDIELLETLQLKRVFDYRRDAEAARKPDPYINNVINERIPVFAEHNITANMFTKEGEISKAFLEKYSREGFIKIYEQMPIQNRSYKRLMELVKKPEENLPLVHHCTGGRDRTGVGAMIILLTLDVPFHTVLEDYLLSNVTLEYYHNQIFEKVSALLNEEEFRRFKEGFLLQEDYLQASYQSIIHTYHHFDHYLFEEFGMDAEMRNRIKDYCLE